MTSDIGVYKDGVWYLDMDGSGTWSAGDRADRFGGAGWAAMVGDWNGDSTTEIGVYEDGVWYLEDGPEEDSGIEMRDGYGFGGAGWAGDGR